MIIDAALYLFTGILVLKCIWNFGLPVVIARRRIKSVKGIKSGVSFMPSVELLALFCLIVISVFSPGSLGIFTLKNVVLLGGGLIVITYLNLFIMSILLGWMFK